MRQRASKVTAALVASCTLSSFMVVLASSTPARATVSQAGGDDVAPWVNGWSWTYNQTFTYNDGSTADVTLNETVTYTVSGQTVHNGYDTYQVGMSGTITGGSGTAQGYTLKNLGGNVSGTAWYETGSRALVEEDQTQNLTGQVSESIITVGFNATVTLNLAASPPLAFEDFRLHNGDTWSINSNVAETGSFSYNASGIASGSSPINNNQPVHGAENVATGTVNEPIASGIPVDKDTINDTADQVANTSDWAPRYENVAYESLSVPISGSAATLTMSLASAHTPAPSTTTSEAVAPDVVCGGATVSVSGALSSGQSGVPVAVVMDEQLHTPGQVLTHDVTTGSGGAYSTSFTAPALSDGLNKAGVRGSFGIVATPSGGAGPAEATLEVSPQDCSSITYAGDTSGPQGGAANMSATVTDVVTGQPLGGVPVTFALSGQSASATATTGSDGVASTSLALSGPPRNATLTASYGGDTDEAPSSATSPFEVTTDATLTALTPSEPQATIGDAVTFTADVSTSGPTVTAAPTGSVTFTVDGNQLGTAPVPLGADGTATSQADSTMSLGNHTVVATYSGDVNYAGSSQSITFFVHQPLTATTTTLTSGPDPSVFGQAVNLTATVTGADGGTPAGTVDFYDGTTLVGQAPLDGTTPDQAWIQVDTLGAGVHSLTATYEGDDVTYNASNSAPISQTVDQASTATSVTSSANPSVTGQGVTFDVTVAAVPPGAGVPTGSVQLSVNGVELGAPATLSGGSASIDDPAPATGSDVVVARYAGDPNFAKSSGTLQQTVQPDATTTTLESSPNPSLTGEGVTFTATVSPVAPGAGDPTGTVTFDDGTQPIGSATLAPTANGDQATIELTSLDQGDHTITAIYAGDPGFAGSQSQPLDQTVNEAPPVVDTTTTVSSSQSPSVYGQGVAFVATVTPDSGANTPTGTVQFSVDGADIGAPVTVVDGVANSQGISTLVAGDHTIIAAFQGDPGFADSGQVFTQTVEQADTTVSGQASADPASYGQSVTFSATVAAVAPGTGLPSGVVQFSVDGSALGSPVPLTDGTATSGPVDNLAPGTHTVTLLASGDANFVGSSGSFTFTVSTIPTQTTLQLSPDPVVFGQPETMSATVTHDTGPGSPTGTVTFMDGSTTLAAVPLTPNGGSGTATFTTSDLAAGGHSITAVYSGDDTFAGSSSAPAGLTVGPAPTTVTVTPPTLYIKLVGPTELDHNGLKLLATLTSDGAPVAGQTLVFEAGSGSHPVICSGVTDAAGTATCNSTIAGATELLLSGSVLVVYAGDASYQASSGRAPLVSVL